MATILLTGFEPFNGEPLNPSAEAVQCLADTALPSLQVQTAILPVDASRISDVLRAALVSLRPDWCLMLGQSQGRAALTVERVAVNLADFRIPDNAGNQLRDQPIVAGGPVAYFAAVPAARLRDAALAAGVPAELSLSAGAFLCNMALYHALHLAATLRLPTRCGFVHVPSLPQQALGGPAHPTMALETICSGVRAMLLALEEESTTGAGDLAMEHACW
jgi:pyroglutamyl-peptidase